jgi:hypothetical protein
VCVQEMRIDLGRSINVPAQGAHSLCAEVDCRQFSAPHFSIPFPSQGFPLARSPESSSITIAF